MNRPRIRKRKLVKRAVIVVALLPLVPWGLGWSVLKLGLEAYRKRRE
jgi:hypothetical protein